MSSTEFDAVLAPLEDDDPRMVSDYRLAGRLGAGGMGRVYLSTSDRARY